MRARGIRPWALTAAALAMMSAAALSLTPLALPAVTVPFSRNGVGSLASCSSVVAGRGCSSQLTLTGSPLRCGISTGVISRASRPISIAVPAFCCDRCAKASWSLRLIFQRSATFSPVSASNLCRTALSSDGLQSASQWSYHKSRLCEKRRVRLGHNKRRTAHAFRPTGDDKRGFTGLDHPGCGAYRFHARRA